MTDGFDSSALPPRTATDLSSAFTTIWLHPGETIREIVDQDAQYGVIPITLAYSIITALASWLEYQDRPFILLIVFLVVGPMVAVGGLYLGGAVVKLVSGWFGGTASAEELRAALAWSEVVLIPQQALICLGRLGGDAAFLLAAIPSLIFGVWGLITALVCLSEVNEYSKGAGCLTWIVAGVLLSVPVGLFALVVSQLFGH